MATLNGADLSSNNGNINFDQYFQSNDFCIIKTSEGIGYEDSKWRDNYNEVINRNKLVSFYHFLRPDLKDNNAKGEADWFLSLVAPIIPIGAQWVLDFERNCPDPVGYCCEFFKEVKATLGFNGFIYINKSTKAKYNWQPLVDLGCALWLADYEDNGVATPWPFIAIRQTTSGGSVPGINGRVDLDIFYGDKSQWLAYGKQGSVPAPTPVQEPVVTPIPEPIPTQPIETIITPEPTPAPETVVSPPIDSTNPTVNQNQSSITTESGADAGLQKLKIENEGLLEQIQEHLTTITTLTASNEILARENSNLHNSLDVLNEKVPALLRELPKIIKTEENNLVNFLKEFFGHGAK